MARAGRARMACLVEEKKMSRQVSVVRDRLALRITPKGSARRRRGNAILATCVAAAGVAGACNVTSAANLTWATAPGTNQWNAANWIDNTGAPATPNLTGDTLAFLSSNTTTLNNDLTNASFAGITFAN